MKFRYLFLVIVMLVIFEDSAKAQFWKNLKNGKKTSEQSQQERVMLSKQFEPIRKSSAIEKPSIEFPNINLIPYYYSEDHLNLIRKYHKDKDWEKLYPLLIDYISSFGVENFTDDIGMIWDLAKLATHLNKKDDAKEFYRLLLKHHTGNMEIPQITYDSLSGSADQKYVDLEYYKTLIDKWNLIDSLRPDEDLGGDIGDGVNSDYQDYGLTIGKSDSMIYFTSRRHDGEASKHKELNHLENEDIYISYKNADGEWEKAKAFTQINTSFNEGSPAMSPDGKLIVFSRCFAPGGQGNCDLYQAEWIEKDSAWSQVVNMGKYINGKTWDSHPTFSVTGDTLYFSSDRKGGFGNADLYYSIRLKNNRFLPPKNLGPIINTKHNEVSPFIHPQNNVMYFSSDGHIVNFGDFDIFKTYPLLGENWSEPHNVGPFVNTEGSEFYFTIDSKASTLFYARAESINSQDLDIYTFSLPMGGQPNAIVRFFGRITDETTGDVFGGVVAIFDVEDKIPIAPKYIREDGTFEFDLIDKKKYLLIISGENFFRIEQLFELDGETKVDIPVKQTQIVARRQPDKVVKSIQFKSVEFELGKANILANMENDLHSIVNFLTEHPEFSLTIEGHTDSDGDSTANKLLSQKRADAIKKYISDYGQFPDDKITAKGLGSNVPLVSPELTEEDKKVNRRVEFTLHRLEIEEEIEDDGDSDDEDW